MSLYNLVRAYTSTLGTAAVIIGAAVPGYLDFALVPNGAVVSYGIHEDDQSEVGRGTWNSVTNTLSRDTVLASTNNGNKISLLGNAQVFITVLAEDFDHARLSNIGVNTHLQIDAKLHDAVTIGVGNGLSLAGQELSLGLAGAGAAGALSASDWTTFNNKQNALGFTPLNPANNLSDVANAATARDNLGLEIGVDVQAYDVTLQSISALGTAADKMLYTTGVDTWAEWTITAFGRSLIDDADGAAARTTLGLVAGGTGDIWIKRSGNETMTEALTIQSATGANIKLVLNSVFDLNGYYNQINFNWGGNIKISLRGGRIGGKYYLDLTNETGGFVPWSMDIANAAMGVGRDLSYYGFEAALYVIVTDATKSVQILQGYIAQSGDMLKVLDVWGTRIAAIDANGGLIINDDGRSNADTTIKSDTYNAIFIDASNDSILLMNNASGKVGFFNVPPIVQPTTAIVAATFVANTSGIVNDSATFDGYTIGQVVKALRNLGALA